MAAAPVLVPCLVWLRKGIDAIAPARAEDSDGWIGDTAHQQETSDHNPDETGSVPIHDADRLNEVHAVDVDKDLRESDLSMEKVVQFLIGRCRSGAETRLRYVIYNRRIWEASNGWRQRVYTGRNPHTEHAHFSASYDTAREASTASWQLEEIPVSLTIADKEWLAAKIDAAATTAAKRVWADRAERVAPKPGQSETASKGAIVEFSEKTVRDEADRVLTGLVQAKTALAAAAATQTQSVLEAIAALSPPPTDG
jgi:beta-xylosidase